VNIFADSASRLFSVYSTIRTGQDSRNSLTGGRGRFLARRTAALLEHFLYYPWKKAGGSKRGTTFDLENPVN
jgi:hypothetical protein